MKQAEIKKCAICGNGVMHKGIPVFYTIKIQRHGVDAGAIQRQNGLEQMLGKCAVLASVMGPDEDMTKPITDEKELWVCDDCVNKDLTSLLIAMEKPE